MSSVAGETGGVVEHVRHVRLPADRRTPAAARALVRAVLAEAGLDEVINEALLLTTELSTNAVVHAGTELDIEIAADTIGLTVTVTDFAGGPIETVLAKPKNDLSDIDQVSERGRGLLLVDHFSTRWGTIHEGARKGVWFRLDRGGPDHSGTAGSGDGNGLVGGEIDSEVGAEGVGAGRAGAGRAGAGRAGAGAARDQSHHATVPPELATGAGLTGDTPVTNPLAGVATPAVVAGPVPTATEMAALSQTMPDPHVDDALPDFAAGLLSRVAEMVGAAGGVVRLDRGDGAGPRVLARYGRPPHPDDELVRVALAVNRPYRGELELDAAPSAYAQPLAALVAERLSLHVENDRLRRADLRRQTWLTFLAEASELLAQSLDVHLTMALIPQLIVPRLGQWCAVHSTDEWGRLHLAAASHADESMLPRLHAVLAESGPDSMTARLREASRTESQLPLGQPLEGFAFPLIARGQRLGTLAVGRHTRHRHDPDEIGVLEDVSRRAALAIENARIHDERRKVAHTLQQSLLPPVLPVVKGIGFAAEYVPTGDAAEVGGDFYDVVPLSDDRWLVVVGDVSGKGVQAAAVTGLVRDVIRVLVRDLRPLPEALNRLNDTLVERGGGRYCTLALASVSPSPAGDLTVSLHLAGHDRPVLVRADGRATFVGTGGTALGLLDEVATPSSDVLLRPGDALVFYTDGVTERRRGRDLFGPDRLRDAAAPLAGYSADVIAARLRTAVIGFSADAPRDDIAILVLRNDFVPG